MTNDSRKTESFTLHKVIIQLSSLVCPLWSIRSSILVIFDVTFASRAPSSRTAMIFGEGRLLGPGSSLCSAQIFARMDCSNTNNLKHVDELPIAGLGVFDRVCM